MHIFLRLTESFIGFYSKITPRQRLLFTAVLLLLFAADAIRLLCSQPAPGVRDRVEAAVLVNRASCSPKEIVLSD